MENQPLMFSQFFRHQPSSRPAPVPPLSAAPPPPPPSLLAATSGSGYLVHQDTDKGAWAPGQEGVTATSSNNGGVASKHNKAGRKQRFAFQTRSKVDVLDDGYRWRKYGQKAVKNTKFPRSYYRCTHPGCGVKKQVQRLSRDEEVVVTTYDGVHNHPIQRPNDSFDHILREMQIYTGYMPTKSVPRVWYDD